MRRQIQQLSLVLSLSLAGCAKKEEPPRPPPTPKTAVQAPDADAFDAALSIESQVAVGAPASLTARVTAKPGYHVNPDYPTSFKPDDPNSVVKFAQNRFELKDTAEKIPCSDKAEDTCQVRAKVPFTVDAAGPAKASGVLSFSVCNPDRCLIEKVPLTVALDVH